MIKRLRAFALIVVYLCSLWLPAQQAQAFAPVAVIAAPQIVTAAGSSYVLGAVAGIVGLVGLYLEIKDAQDNSIRVPLNGNEIPAPSAPQTATATPSGPTETIPPTSTKVYYSACPAGGGIPSADTAEAACSACDGYISMYPAGGETVALFYLSGGYYYRNCAGSGFVTSCPSGYTMNSQGLCVPPPPTYTCPAGYTLNGSQCILEDARAVTPDKHVDVKRIGDSYSMASPQDIDKDSVPKHTWGPGYISVGGKTQTSNEPYIVSARPLTSGGTAVTTYTETAPGLVTQETYIVSPTGEVISVARTVTQASINVNPDTGSATLVAPAPIVNPDGTTSTLAPVTQPVSSTPTTQPIQFPNDYARTGEAENAAKPIRDKLTNTENVDDPIQPATSQFDDAFFKDTFTSLLSWSMPAHTSQCPTASFSWNNQTMTIDSHCQLVNDHFSALSSVMSVVWAILALFIVLGA